MRGSPRRSGLRRKGLIALVLAAALAPAARASADTLSLSTNPPAPSDRAPLQVVATGSTTSATLRITYKLTRQGGCTDPSTDNGTSIPPDGDLVGGSPFTDTGALQTLAPGSYLLCGWLLSAADGSTLAGPTSVAFTVAAADSLALTVSDPDPVQGRPLDVIASGIAYDANGIAYATSKPGGGCAGSPTQDGGAQLAPDGLGTGQGPFALTLVSQQVFDPGSTLFCGWLLDQPSGTTILTAQTTLTVRAPQASIAVIVPARADAGQSLPLTLRAHADWGVPLSLYADLLAPGTPGCAATPAGEPTGATQLESGQPVTDTQKPAGDVDTSGTLSAPQTAGTFLICAWLEGGWQGAKPDAVLAGPAAARFTTQPPQTFSGRTRQHLPLSIVYAPVARQILSIDYTDRYRCRGGRVYFSNQPGWWNGVFSTTLGTANFGTLAVKANGRFGAKLYGDPLNRFAISARLSGRTLTGTMKGSGRSDHLVATVRRERCSTGTVRFTIRRR